MPLAAGWLLALVVAGLFAALGSWQWGRAQHKRAMLADVEQVIAQRDRAAPLAAAGDLDARAAYGWAAGSGRFADAPAVLLDNQSRQGRPGVRAYRAFVPEAGAPLLVELGWLPVPAERTMPSVPLPAGAPPLRGLLAPPPSAGFVSATPAVQPDGALLVAALDIPTLAAALDLPALAPRVFKLDPQLPLGFERDLDILPNTLPPERHVGYAVQWFGLALAVLVTAAVLTWRRRRRQ